MRVAFLGVRQMIGKKGGSMDDLRSRQEAIYAVNTALFPKINTAKDAEKALRNLPPAQPEIVQCKDYKYGAPNGKYGCRVYHYKRYETHDMKPDDFCSRAERRTDE